MAYNYEYPYTDPYRYNDDWLLRKMRDVIEEWAAMKKQFDDLNQAFNDLKTYVMNYFKNLDVQDEINNKLDAMISDGTFDTIIFDVLSTRFDVKNVKGFGAKGDGLTNDTAAINSALTGGGIIFFPAGTYIISGHGPSGTALDGKGLVVASNSRIVLHPNAIIAQESNSDALEVIFNLHTVKNVIIEGGSLQGTRSNSTPGPQTKEWSHGIIIDTSQNIVIRDMRFINFYGDGIYVGQGGGWEINSVSSQIQQNIILERLIFDTIGRNAISLCTGQKIVVNDVDIDTVNYTNPKSGIDIEKEGNFSPYLREISIENVVTKNCLYGIQVWNADDAPFIRVYEGNTILLRASVTLSHIGNSKAPIVSIYDDTPIKLKIFDSSVRMATSSASIDTKVEIHNSIINIAVTSVMQGDWYVYNCEFIANPTVNRIHAFNTIFSCPPEGTNYIFRVSTYGFFLGCRFIKKGPAPAAISCATGAVVTLFSNMFSVAPGVATAGVACNLNPEAVVNSNVYGNFNSFSSGTLIQGAVNFHIDGF